MNEVSQSLIGGLHKEACEWSHLGYDAGMSLSLACMVQGWGCAQGRLSP